MKTNTNIIINSNIKIKNTKMIYYEKKELPTQMYEVNSIEGPIYFECLFHWMENKRDYHVTINNFGLRKIISAGSSGKNFRRHFTQEEINSAKILIEKYFARELTTTDFPLSDTRSRCLGVRYAPDWIVETTNEQT